MSFKISHDPIYSKVVRDVSLTDLYELFRPLLSVLYLSGLSESGKLKFLKGQVHSYRNNLVRELHVLLLRMFKSEQIKNVRRTLKNRQILRGSSISEEYRNEDLREVERVITNSTPSSKVQSVLFDAYLRATDRNTATEDRDVIAHNNLVAENDRLVRNVNTTLNPYIKKLEKATKLQKTKDSAVTGTESEQEIELNHRILALLYMQSLDDQIGPNAHSSVIEQHEEMSLNEFFNKFAVEGEYSFSDEISGDEWDHFVYTFNKCLELVKNPRNAPFFANWQHRHFKRHIPNSVV
jgi:hypothetical protein